MNRKQPASKRPPTRARTGRASAYRPEYVAQVEVLTSLGAIDAQLAEFWGVSRTTIGNWKRAHPEFLASLKRGKAVADAEVANALFRRALGFAHRAIKIFADPKTGSKLTVPYVERYPPDTTACIFWLKNRQPEAWRDRLEHTGKDGKPLRPPTNEDVLPPILDRLTKVAERGEKGRAATEGADPLLTLAEIRGAG